MILFRRVFGKVHFIGFVFPRWFLRFDTNDGAKVSARESKQKAPALPALEGKQ
jgi:hypothetical protein